MLGIIISVKKEKFYLVADSFDFFPSSQNRVPW